jgi:hypothetical protein
MTREPTSLNEKVLEEATGDAEGLPLLQVHTIQLVFSTTHEAKYTSSPWRHTRSPSRAGECANWSAHPARTRSGPSCWPPATSSFTVPKNSNTTPPGLSLGTPGKLKTFTKKSAPRRWRGSCTHTFQHNSLAVGRHPQQYILVVLAIIILTVTNICNTRPRVSRLIECAIFCKHNLQNAAAHQ